MDNDSWQQGYLQGDELTELQFWIGAPQPAAANQPVSTGPAVNPSSAPATAPAHSKRSTAGKSPKVHQEARTSPRPAITAEKRRRKIKKPAKR